MMWSVCKGCKIEPNKDWHYKCYSAAKYHGLNKLNEKTVQGAYIDMGSGELRIAYITKMGNIIKYSKDYEWRRSLEYYDLHKVLYMYSSIQNWRFKNEKGVSLDVI